MSMRVLIAVTHLLGAGHLTRAAAITRAFARAGHEVALVSGGTRTPLVSTAGVQTVQLPPVRIVGTDFRSLLDEDGQLVGPEHLAARRRLLVDTLHDLRPDVVVTELFPFGRRSLADEFMELVTVARALRPRPLILASIRDILVVPDRRERVAEVHDRLRTLYDAVLVHGDPDVVPLHASWPLEDGLRSLVHYTGYVDCDGPIGGARGAHNADGDIVVSGGSSAAGGPLYRAALAASHLVPAHRLRILVGTGMPEPAFADLQRAAPENATVERARSDFRRLLARAAVSVSQAGYNTVVDLLRTGVRAVLVPFEAGRETEQHLRAECLQSLGLAEVVSESDLSPAALADGIRKALRRPGPRVTSIRMDGAERSVAVVEELVRSRSTPSLITPASRPNGHALDAALERAAECGTRLAFWWRDDDAVAYTPRLDQLLALAQRLNVPLSIAAIPALVQDSLVQRLADEPLASLLVHGLRHANHAPSSEKKAEFGPHRALEGLGADAAAGLAAMRAAFGASTLPIFVPPWNRITSQLAARLPQLGFVGLSTFGERRACIAGLSHINVHIDPIDWRAGGGLRARDGLMAQITHLLADRAQPGRRRAEPIGLLTHHLVHDEATWTFCEELLERLAAHSSVRFHSAETIFLGDNAAPKLW
jgi:predicted glycosyltransferase